MSPKEQKEEEARAGRAAAELEPEEGAERKRGGKGERAPSTVSAKAAQGEPGCAASPGGGARRPASCAAVVGTALLPGWHSCSAIWVIALRNGSTFGLLLRETDPRCSRETPRKTGEPGRGSVGGGSSLPASGRHKLVLRAERGCVRCSVTPGQEHFCVPPSTPRAALGLHKELKPGPGRAELLPALADGLGLQARQLPRAPPLQAAETPAISPAGRERGAGGCPA